LEKILQSHSLQVGDLVRYNYGTSPTIPHIDGVRFADIGVVLGVEWQDDLEVIKVYFFSSNTFKLSYAQYLDTITQLSREKK